MLHRISLLTALFALAISLCACSSEDDPVSPDPDAGLEDVDEPLGDCTLQSDCEEGQFCHDDQCHEAPTCASQANYQPCVSAFEELDEELAIRAHCDGQYCRVACLLDGDCPDGELCTDDGYCRQFTGELTDVHPGGDAQAPLQAGFGERLLDFPVGISLGGYAMRDYNTGGRYAESLGASLGTMHGLNAGAVALDDGQRQLLFMRAPIIFPTMAIHEAVARNLQEETGRDWRSSLVISGTHTHSGPARYWQIPEPGRALGGGLGQFGIGEYHDQSFLWLVDSMTEAALEAIDDLSPAQMGWQVIESFDTDDVIARDRWGETPPFDDNRVLVMRIDDPDDTPRGLLMSFGIHPTVHTGAYATDDVIVGAETMLEKALTENFDTKVPVYFFQQNGGTMSPTGHRQGHREAQRYENLGTWLVDRTIDDILALETTDDWSFEGHTHRFPIQREYLDYGPGEFEGYYQGGFQCGVPHGDGWHEHVAPDDYSCLGFHQVLYHRPMSLITKSQISAFQLNDLTLVTMPGELSMTLGWQVQKHLEAHYDIDPFHSFTWGYAQDHLLYLLPTNLRGERPPFPGLSLPEGEAPDDYPDYAFSFLQGGYEAGMSPWGHNLGDYLLNRAVEAVGLMRGDITQPQFEPPYPDQHTLRDSEPFPIDTSDPSEVGTITEAPSGEVERREFVEVAWLGGDPGAEIPQAPLVTLERLDTESGEFETVIRRNHRPYDNREFTMLTRHRRDADDRHEWALYWEELADFPTGTYRFRIDGHYLESEGGEPQPYQTTTDPFDLVPSTQLAIEELAITDSDTISFEVYYPPADELNLSYSAPDRGRASGSYRMHNRHVPSGQPIFVDADDVAEVEIDLPQTTPSLSVDEVLINTDTGGDVPVTRIDVTLSHSVDAGTPLDVSIEVIDVHQNSAHASETLEYSQ